VLFGVLLGIALSIVLIPQLKNEAASSAALAGFGTACRVVAAPFSFAVPLFSLRRVTRDTGNLVQLGVGTVGGAQITAKAYESVKSVHRLCGCYVGLYWSLGGIFILQSIAEDTGRAKSLWGAVTLTLSLTILYPLLMSWYLTIYEAAVVVSHTIDAVRDSISSCNLATSSEEQGGNPDQHADRVVLTNKKWDDEVVMPVLTLINKTLPILNDGYAWSLLWTWVPTWLQMFGLFIQFVNKGNSSAEDSEVISNFLSADAVVFFLSLILPVFYAWPLARASDKCIALKESLNQKRLEAMNDVEAHNKIVVVETALQKCNDGQVRALDISQLQYRSVCTLPAC